MKRILESERLFLREFIHEDLALLFHLDSDPEVLRYIGKAKTIDESRSRLQKAFQDYKGGKGLGKWMAVEKHSGKEIGWYVLNYLDNTKLVEIGYRLKSEFWNMGYATEMSIELLKYGFQIMNLKEIYAAAHIENIASNKVLQKAGLKFVETFEFDNDLHHWYKLTRTDWEETID